MNSMKLSGVTSTGGGVYSDVKVEGVATINGDITCDEMVIQGVSTFKGGINCGDLTLEGTCKIGSSVRASKCRLYGVLNVGGGFEAESFTGSASFRIGGTLNAETVDIKFVHGSAAAEVCGREIRITKERHSSASEFIMQVIPWSHKGRSFSCGLIEGDLIELENVEAQTVRGKNVKIGTGCSVKLAEYHENLEVAPDAKVEKSVKV